MTIDPFESQISRYIVAIRDWKISNALIQYLKVNENFSLIFERYIKCKECSLEEMNEIEKTLSEIRNDLSTIFRHLIDPKKKLFENAEKFTPNDEEMRLIINVELLYHTVVIVEGYKHNMEYYSEESDGFVDAHESLSTILVKIQSLFDEGRSIIREMLKYYKNNVLLLSWFLENRDNVAITFGESIETLLTDFFEFKNIADAYLKVGEFFLASGWGDRARGVLAIGARLKRESKKSTGKNVALALEKDQK